MEPHERKRSSRVAASLDAAPASIATAPLTRRPGLRGRARDYPRRSSGKIARPNLPSVFRRLLLLAVLLVLLPSVANLLLAQSEGTGIRSLPVAPFRPLPDSPGTHDSLDAGQITWRILVVVALILLNAFFAAADYALITVRRTLIHQRVEEGNRSAILIEKLLKQPMRLQATIQTCLTLVATFSAAYAAQSFVDPLAAWYQAHTTLAFSAANTLAFLLVVVPVALLTLVVGEVAPKSLAMRHSERLALVAAHPVAWLQALLLPMVALLTVLSNLVVRPFGGTASFTTPAVNEEELKMLVEASEEQGVLQADETEMINSILDFGDLIVRKVMTPRIRLTAIDSSASLPELIALINESGHSRIPVYEGDLDNILGIVHAKDLLSLPLDDRRNNVAIRRVMRQPYFIPETKKVNDLLAEFRRSHQQLAMVRDEYGVTSGLITIEDLLEEIVGDIQDEYDEEEPLVQVIDANATIFDGTVGLEEVNDRMGLDLPEEEADTIGGYVFGLLGHQAKQGERVGANGLEFVVEATDGRRILKVRLLRRPDLLAEDRTSGNTRFSNEAGSSPNGNGNKGLSNGSAGNERNGVETSGVETAPGMPPRQ